MARSIAEFRYYLEDRAAELNELAELDQMEVYRRLTEIGNAIRPLVEGDLTDENFVHGCVSNVYVAHNCSDGAIEFRGSSESLVVRGYLAILIEALSGLSPADLVDNSRQSIEWFAEKTNIRASLTPSRANAFGNIYELMVRKSRACRDGA